MEKNYPLSRLTTWKIGGPAEAVYWPPTKQDLAEVWRRAQEAAVPVWLIGQGSNLLLPDEGLPGVILVTTALREIAWGDLWVRVEAGYPLARLAQEAGERGFAGLEFARGIPGSVGGAVIMNAGADGGVMASRLQNVTALWPDGTIKKMAKSELEFAYRFCSLSGRAWVLETELVFLAGDRQKILQTMQENLSSRKLRQPLDQPNAGSVFQNPPGDAAGRLIEAAGWKGRSLGGAQVSPKHANFIVNTGNAKARDVLVLLEEIREDVRLKFGITLQPEVRTFNAKNLYGNWNKEGKKTD